MYVGHVAVALGVRGVRRDVPLWLLVLAAQGCDWLETLQMTGGVRDHAMLSHSLPAALGAAAMLALLALLLTRSTPAAGVVGAVYLSHLPLDYLTGLKPTVPGAGLIGLNLYAHPVLDFVAEAILIVLGWRLYRATRRPADRAAGARPLRVMLAGLLALQLAGDILMSRPPWALRLWHGVEEMV